MQKGFSPIIILVAAVTLTLFGAGLFYIGRLTAPKTQPQDVSSKVNTPNVADNNTKEFTPSSENEIYEPSTIDETADWPIYQSDDKQYSLKYPYTFSFSNYNEGTYKGILLSYLGPTQTSSKRTETSLMDGLVVKTILVTDTGKSLEEFAETQRQNEEKALPVAPTVSLLSQLTVGGKPAFTYTTEGMGNAKVVFVKLNNSILKIIGLYEGDTLARTKYLSLFNRILSTFKFIQ